MDQKSTSPSPAPQKNTAIPPTESSWSWGAFWLDAFFLIGIRRYTFLLWYLLAFVPLVNILFFIPFKIYLGIKGRDMAYRSEAFANQDEVRGFLKGIDHAGKVLFFAMLILFCLGILMTVLLATVFYDEFLVE